MNKTASKTATFVIDDMSCASCVGRVERALRAVPGVSSTAVNLIDKTARVTFDAPAAPQALSEALARAGYPPAEETARLSVSGMTCASCVGRVERALRASPGVISAEVNLATETASLRYATGVTSPTELAAAVTRAGYDARPASTEAASAAPDRQAAEERVMRRRAILAILLALPVVVLAMGGHMVPAFHHWIMATIGERTSWIIQFVLTAAVLFGPGFVFLRLGLPALLRGAPEMNSLVALGSLAAFGYSTVATFAPGLLPPAARDVYFEAAATIVALILLGRMLEARAKGRAGQAIARLVALRPDTARVLRPDGPVDLPLSEVRRGDLVLLPPGARVAVDGTVTEGSGFIDESMLTGEPMPAAKAPGDRVTGGTVNGTAALTYRVTATGDDTVLARIVRMVGDAQGAKLPVQALVDRITMWFVPAVMAVSALTFAVWMVLGPEPVLSHALVAAISVLVIACPCAMGLATPVSVLVGTGRGAELGILFRRGDALQRLSETRIFAFDKTGTLTEGQPRLTDLIPSPGVDGAALLARMAAAEAQSEHPLARAFLDEAERRGLTIPPVSATRALPGRGIEAQVNGTAILIGNARLMREKGIDVATQAKVVADLAAAGKTPILVAEDGHIAGTLAVADPVKPHSAATVDALHRLGVQTAMISGDTRTTAEAVAARLGIDRVVADVLPEGKVDAVAELGQGGPVAFVGDGINDAPALAAADVGIAVGTGTDVAIEAAEVVLMSGDTRGVVDALGLSRAVMRNIRQNLFWAFGYNVILVPVAAGALYPLNGMMLSPMLAAAAMALSSVFVVTNALRLRRAGPWI